MAELRKSYDSYFEKDTTASEDHQWIPDPFCEPFSETAKLTPRATNFLEE
jgi:hypothetical protein